jgi:hypothetical protein
MASSSSGLPLPYPPDFTLQIELDLPTDIFVAPVHVPSSTFLALTCFLVYVDLDLPNILLSYGFCTIISNKSHLMKSLYNYGSIFVSNWKNLVNKSQTFCVKTLTKSKLLYLNTQRGFTGMDNDDNNVELEEWANKNFRLENDVEDPNNDDIQWLVDHEFADCHVCNFKHPYTNEP